MAMLNNQMVINVTRPPTMFYLFRTRVFENVFVRQNGVAKTGDELLPNR